MKCRGQDGVMNLIKDNLEDVRNYVESSGGFLIV